MGQAGPAAQGHADRGRTRLGRVPPLSDAGALRPRSGDRFGDLDPAPQSGARRRLRGGKLSLPHRLRCPCGALRRPATTLPSGCDSVFRRSLHRPQYRRRRAEQRRDPLPLLFAVGYDRSGGREAGPLLRDHGCPWPDNSRRRCIAPAAGSGRTDYPARSTFDTRASAPPALRWR